MFFKIGDLVTRKSYDNDIVFKIVEVNEKTAYLKGLNVRLCADSNMDDLKLVENAQIDDNDVFDRINTTISLDRNEYFYLPGKVLHFDGDIEYLERCMNFYKKLKIMAYGVNLKEDEMPLEINKYLEDLHPDIVVITGHDVFYKKSGKSNDIDSYKNSKNFAQAVKMARKYESSHDKLIIIAGACQSDYEELIRAGANFASSPKRVNLHALDPAIVATSVALADKSKPIDLINIIKKTKYKAEGIGGIITNGTMYTGYPR
ncbi:MAG: sporulation peptidase YabG [Bacilli bacterium]|nr:sporulation peptidase YabG [Bacilli bacterium]